MDPVLATGLFTIAGVLVGALAAHRLEYVVRKDERQELRRRAEGRISAIAYALHRQVEAWLEEWPSEEDPALAGHVDKLTHPAIFQGAEDRAHAIIAESVNASSRTVDAAQEVLALLYSANRILSEAQSQPLYERDDQGAPVAGSLKEPWGRRLHKAKWQLENCRDELESLIHPRLKRLKEVLAELPPASS